MDNRRRFEEREHRHFEDDKRRRHMEDEFRFGKRDFDRLRKEIHVGRRPFPPRGKITTKLFENKASMIEYVNKVGEEGHNIDIFKIEDNLYKVVVMEFDKRPPFEFDEDIHVDIDIDE